MWDMTVTYNGQSYIATYNSQTGYYEVELTAPSVGGVNVAEIEFTDIFDEQYTSEKAIQTFIKDPLKLDLNKVFMWIFNYYDFSIKDIVEIADYDINVDEETNAKTIVNVLKKTNAQSRDLVAIKKNNECIYWGIIDEIQNENGKQLYQYSINYITNLFNRTIKLQNENLIKTTGVEDFIENIIENEFVDNEDTFINLTWLEVVVLTHTSKQISVTNVENGIFNLHTWMTNCTQNYDITYSFSIVNQKLRLTIKCMTYSKELIDISAQAVSDYTEVFETNVVSKVTVLYDKVSVFFDDIQTDISYYESDEDLLRRVRIALDQKMYAIERDSGMLTGDVYYNLKRIESDHKSYRVYNGIDAEYFNDTISIPFENILISVPLEYDKVLKVSFGEDYMVPQMKPSSHEYPFYRIQEASLIKLLKESGISSTVDEFCDNWHAMIGFS